jgi:hypothetical protein
MRRGVCRCNPESTTVAVFSRSTSRSHTFHDAEGRLAEVCDSPNAMSASSTES